MKKKQVDTLQHFWDGVNKMNSKLGPLEIGDLKFNCEYIEDIGENKRYKKDAPCKRCKNHNKCKIYIKDHNQRMHRKMIANIGKWEKLEIKEAPKITFDPEAFLYSAGMNFVFDYKKEWTRPVEALYLNVKWVKLGKQRSRKKVTQQISEKLMQAIKDGNIPTITLEEAEKTVGIESNKSRLQKKLKALGGKVPTLGSEVK